MSKRTDFITSLGAACGGSLLPVGGGKSTPPPYAHGVAPYFQLYGTGQFDGQNSGHDFFGTVFLPSTGKFADPVMRQAERSLVL